MKCTNSAKSKIYANMQLTINSFRPLFPDKISPPPTFSKIPDISLTAVKFPDISRFSRQVVTLHNLIVPLPVRLMQRSMLHNQSVCLRTCEHDILKTNELVLMQIGTSGLQGKGMKQSTSGVRRSRVKVTGTQSGGIVHS